jgi:hypothetical protein
MNEDSVSIEDLGGFLRDAGAAYQSVTNKQLANQTPAQATPPSGSAVGPTSATSAPMSKTWMWVLIGVIVVVGAVLFLRKK